jgi:hypothetical protein
MPCERPLQSRGILVVRRAQGDSKWQAPLAALMPRAIAAASRPGDANLKTTVRSTWPVAQVVPLDVPT